MGNAKTLKALKSLTDVELISAHDEISKSTVVGLNYYLEEIRHRESGHINKSLKQMTAWITLFTLIMLGLTAMNTYLIYVQSTMS